MLLNVERALEGLLNTGCLASSSVSELAGRGGTEGSAFLSLFQEMLLLLPSAGTCRITALNCSMGGIHG